MSSRSKRRTTVLISVPSGVLVIKLPRVSMLNHVTKKKTGSDRGIGAPASCGLYGIINLKSSFLARLVILDPDSYIKELLIEWQGEGITFASMKTCYKNKRVSAKAHLDIYVQNCLRFTILPTHSWLKVPDVRNRSSTVCVRSRKHHIPVYLYTSFNL